ncbi:hypothetical protein [Clostridium paridis]|uniref:WYL domain-containing protein n=1 Tax=Clostridium paridis TaxID=2803863 RepID=A0A937K5T6_9CLOT|nr:hypothetical protein [Clostridium paridis]MBL4932745.1 hypothetical protein [Clostridium paridis]
MNKEFVQAVHEKKLILLKFHSNEKGIITRTCVPFDFGPSKIYKDGQNRYHFYDLDSPSNNHNLSILPTQIINIEVLSKSFEPSDFVTWSKINWFLKRDWGKYS